MNIYDITFKMCKKKSVGMVLMGSCDRGGGQNASVYALQNIYVIGVKSKLKLGVLYSRAHAKL